MLLANIQCYVAVVFQLGITYSSGASSLHLQRIYQNCISLNTTGINRSKEASCLQICLSS